MVVMTLINSTGTEQDGGVSFRTPSHGVVNRLSSLLNEAVIFKDSWVLYSKMRNQFQTEKQNSVV
jgi:hypothetical protein